MHSLILIPLNLLQCPNSVQFHRLKVNFQSKTPTPLQCATTLLWLSFLLRLAFKFDFHVWTSRLTFRSTTREGSKSSKLRKGINWDRPALIRKSTHFKVLSVYIYVCVCACARVLVLATGRAIYFFCLFLYFSYHPSICLYFITCTSFFTMCTLW